MRKIFVLKVLFILFIISPVVVKADIGINVVGIKQGDNYLEKVDNKYVLTSIDKEISVVYDIVGINNLGSYMVKIDGGVENNNGRKGKPIAFNRYLDDVKVSKSSENTIYSVKLCTIPGANYYVCDSVVDEEEITLYNPFYEQIDGSPTLIVTNVMQGNNDVELEADQYDYVYTVNDAEDLAISLRGVNFNNNYIYNLQYGSSSYGGEYYTETYTGRELNEGIVLNISPLIISDISIYVESIIDNKYVYVKTEVSDDYYYYFHFNIVETNKEKYKLKLKYISPNDEYYEMPYSSFDEYDVGYCSGSNSFLCMLSNEYKKDNGFYIEINGSNYLDEDYDISIEIVRDNNKVFERTGKINGLLLNNKYKYLIENIDMEYGDTIEEQKIPYVVNVKIGKSSYFLKYYYSSRYNFEPSGGYEPGIYAWMNMLDRENTHNYARNVYQVNNALLEENTNIIIYLNYRYDYDYAIYHGYYLENNYSEMFSREKVIDGHYDSSIRMGEVVLNLNEFESLGDRYNDVYQIVYMDGDDVVFCYEVVFVREDGPTIYKKTVKIGDRVVTDSGDPVYADYHVLPTIKMDGLSFDTDKEYTLEISEENYCEHEYDESVPSEYPNGHGGGAGSGAEICHEETSINITIKVMGSELNSGYIYQMSEGIFGVDYRTVNIEVYDGYYDIGGINAIVWYVDIDEYLTLSDNYKLNKQNMSIRALGENITVDEFLEDVQVRENSIIKIFDGEEEVTDGEVTSGMIIKIYDYNQYVNEYFDSYVFPLELFVSEYVLGDINKNGQIDLADIIQLLRKYLSDDITTEDLTLGDMDSSGSIGLNDIIQLLRTYLLS